MKEQFTLTHLIDTSPSALLFMMSMTLFTGKHSCTHDKYICLL